MKSSITQNEIDQYQKDGFICFRNFLNPEEVAELRKEVIESVAAMGTKKVNDSNVDIEDINGKKDYYNQVFTQKLNLWRKNETIAKYMLSPEINSIASKLEGVESFRVWHDQALIKEPFANPTSWHIDNPYWSFYSEHSISIWIALEPATLENGCMWFVPGSHKLTNNNNTSIGNNMADLFNHYPNLRDIDPISVPMNPGDCSFHNGRTAHGAGANMTRKRRIAMTCAYMPINSVFNGQRNILPEEYFKSLKVGDSLENNEWNPLLPSFSMT